MNFVFAYINSKVDGHTSAVRWSVMLITPKNSKVNGLTSATLTTYEMPFL
jgi:hypothetical protein